MRQAVGYARTRNVTTHNASGGGRTLGTAELSPFASIHSQAFQPVRKREHFVVRYSYCLLSTSSCWVSTSATCRYKVRTPSLTRNCSSNPLFSRQSQTWSPSPTSRWPIRTSLPVRRRSSRHRWASSSWLPCSASSLTPFRV